MNEKYELVTIADILAIPSDRFESFLEGFPNYLPVEFIRMVWVDDEKHENTIDLHGMDDGEVKSTTTFKVDDLAGEV